MQLPAHLQVGKISANYSKLPVCIFSEASSGKEKMSNYQPFKKVDRCRLNFLKEKKLKKKSTLNYLALIRSSTGKARAFLYQKGLSIGLHASKVIFFQPVEVII